MKRLFAMIIMTGLLSAAYPEEWPPPYDDQAWQTLTEQDAIYLIISGADVNQRMFDNWTPLICAAWHNPNPDVIRVLVNAGAETEARDDSNMTALMRAALNSKNPVYRISVPPISCNIREFPPQSMAIRPSTL